MGGNNLVNLSLMHPRLFTTLVLVDPVIQRVLDTVGNYSPTKMSAKRRDRWSSRAAAKEAFLRSKFYQAWDPRVLEKWIQHGLRDLPTPLHPQVQVSATPPVLTADVSTATVLPEASTEREVTLTTTKHQEVFTFLRPHFPTSDFPSPSTEPNPITHPDVDLAAGPITPFYSPALSTTFQRLPSLRPSVLYVYGSESPLSAPAHCADREAVTGIGVGGSGGSPKGRVKQHTFPGIGHLIPMEIVNETAEVAAKWIVPELDRWQVLEDAERREWAAVPQEQKSVLSDEYKAMIGVDVNQRIAEEEERKKRSRL